MDLLTLLAELLQFMQLMESMASGVELMSWVISLPLFAQIAGLVRLLMKLVGWLSSLPCLLLGSSGDRRQRMEAAMSAGSSGERLKVIEQRPWSLTASPSAEEERVYVAVGRNVRESSATVAWAVKNRGGRKIGILHVHRPSSLPSRYPEREAKKVQEILNEYRGICVKGGVESEKIIGDFIVMEDIVSGILRLVAEHGVTMLVMGAAADKHYSRNMREPRSKKASVVSKGAPLSCYIWFICDGKLVCAREADIYGNAVYVTPPPVNPQRPTNFSPILPGSTTLGPNDDLIQSPSQNNVTLWSSDESSSVSSNSLSDISMFSTETEIDETACISTPRNQRTNQKGVPRKVNSYDFFFESSEKEDSDADDNLFQPLHQSTKNKLQFMKEDAEEQNNMVKQQQQSFRKKVQQAILIAEKKPSCSAENLAHQAQVKQSEAAYQDELQKRKEIEEMLVQENRKLKQAEEALHNELQKGKQMEEMLTIENRKLKQAEAAYHSELQKRKEREEILARESRKLKQVEAAYHTELQKRKEMEELQVQESHKLKQALEELQNARDQQATLDQREVADSSQISYAEIRKATQGFHESFKIGQGGYGSVYKGLLRCTLVAIKMLNPTSRQGGSEFQQEMEILSRVRHPNLVILMGICMEAKALIYEYLPNGSLEDRLLCKHNSPPLSWQIRIRILNQVCAALIYLHSAGLHGIVHGDLKPDNILLDANFVAKLGDFGISRLMRRQASGASPSAGSTSTICWETDQPKGTVAYIDPEYVQTGVLRPKSDVYSFGVVILRAITGQPPMRITKLVKDAIQARQLERILDKKAGKWPPVLAKELAKLALRCCEMNPRDRPDLKSEVWKVLEPMMGAARPAAPAPNGVS